MARKTVLVCDNCGKEIDEAKGAMMRINFNDARRGAKQADLCDDCAGEDARPAGRAPRPQAEGRRRPTRRGPPLRRFAQFAGSRVRSRRDPALRWVGYGSDAPRRALRTRARSRCSSSATSTRSIESRS